MSADGTGRGRVASKASASTGCRIRARQAFFRTRAYPDFPAPFSPNSTLSPSGEKSTDRPAGNRLTFRRLLIASSCTDTPVVPPAGMSSATRGVGRTEETLPSPCSSLIRVVNSTRSAGPNWPLRNSRRSASRCQAGKPADQAKTSSRSPTATPGTSTRGNLRAAPPMNIGACCPVSQEMVLLSGGASGRCWQGHLASSI